MSGRTSRKKGRAFEQAMARRLAELFDGAKRGIGQARAASEVPDVVLPDSGLWVECKHRNRCNVQAALAQALEASDGGKRGAPVAITRDTGGPILVTMRLDDALDLLRRQRGK